MDYGTVEACKGSGRMSILLFTVLYNFLEMKQHMTEEELEGFGKNLGLIPHPVFWGLGILGSSLGDVSAQIFKGDAGGASVAFDVNMPLVFNMLTAWEVKLGVGASPLAVYIQDLFLGSCPQN